MVTPLRERSDDYYTVQRIDWKLKLTSWDDVQFQGDADIKSSSPT